LSILFRLFDFLASKDFKIIWLSNILTLSIPNVGYCRNVLCTLDRISMFQWQWNKNQDHTLLFN
jgi:hypothetical protein